MYENVPLVYVGQHRRPKGPGEWQFFKITGADHDGILIRCPKCGEAAFTDPYGNRITNRKPLEITLRDDLEHFVVTQDGAKLCCAYRVLGGRAVFL